MASKFVDFDRMLADKFNEFDEYMTYGKWDACCAEGIYADDGFRAVAMFVEFCKTGKVTDEDGKELEG